MCPPGQHRAFWAAPGSGTEPAPVPWPWPRVRVLCAAWWGGGPGRSRGGGRGQAAWPSRRGLSREGRRRTRRAPVGLRAPTTWGSRLGRRASETQPAGAGPGLCMRGAFLQLCRPAGPPPVCRPGVWVPPPNEGGEQTRPWGFRVSATRGHSGQPRHRRAHRETGRRPQRLCSGPVCVPQTRQG